jgi:hypothetical protein
VCSFGVSKVNFQTPVHSAAKGEAKIVKLKITGMACAHCSNHVATTLKALDSIVEQKVEYPDDGQ